MLSSVMYFMAHEVGLVVEREPGRIIGRVRGEFKSQPIARETAHTLGRVMLRNVRLEEAHEVKCIRTAWAATDTGRYAVTVQLLLKQA